MKFDDELDLGRIKKQQEIAAFEYRMDVPVTNQPWRRLYEHDVEQLFRIIDQLRHTETKLRADWVEDIKQRNEIIDDLRKENETLKNKLNLADPTSANYNRALERARKAQAIREVMKDVMDI